MKYSSIISVLFGTTAKPLSAKNPFDGDVINRRRPTVVKIPVSGQDDIQSIADDGFDIIGSKDKTISVLVVHPREKTALEEQYDGVVVDEDATAELRASVDKVVMATDAEAVRAGELPNITGYECYRTVEGTYAAGQFIADNYPGLANWTKIGDSWDKINNNGGYDINVLKLTNKNTFGVDGGDKPVFFANCAIHAREYATAELCTRFAEWLVEGYGVDADMTTLLDHHEIHLVLQSNPDGRKQAEAGDLWRKNTNGNYCPQKSDSRGADLNRNFNFQWSGPGSSQNECDNLYHGEFAESEPETQTLLSYMAMIFPANQRGPNPTKTDPSPDNATGVTMDIHSYGELVLYPWTHTSDTCGNHAQFVTFGRKLAYFNGYTPQPGVDLYVHSGTSMDTYYSDFGVGAFIYELGTKFFQSCDVFENTIVPDNLPSLLYAVKVSRTPFKTPAGPDVVNLSFSQAGPFVPGDIIELTADIDDTRYGTKNGAESSQNIASANFYIDTAPWETGATSNDMAPSDEIFDSNVESVMGTIDTTSMATGRHTVYVVGTDLDGNEGAFSSIFFEIVLGTCVNADLNSGSECISDSECCTVRRRLQDCPGQDCSKKTGSPCCTGYTCQNQSGGVKTCVAQGTPNTTPKPTEAPSLRPSTSQQPSIPPSGSPSTTPSTSLAPHSLVCGCVFPTGSPTTSPTTRAPSPAPCKTRGDFCEVGQESLCCSQACEYKGPNYKCQ